MKLIKIGIYKITNPKGKVYIGQSIDIKKRWKYYISESYNKRDHQNKLFNSLRKYGPESHIFEIIEECKIEQLNEREIYWGKIYDCINPNKGLNLRELGKQGIWTKEAKEKLSLAHIGKHKHTKESKAKISLKMKGYKYSEEQKQKCRDNSGVKGKPNLNGGSKKGWKRTEEQKQNISKKKIGISNPKNLSPIIQYDLGDNIIKEWKSATQVQNEIGIRRDSIGNVLHNKQITAGGYKWKYKINENN
jgi:group I intron endonuclease